MKDYVQNNPRSILITVVLGLTLSTLTTPLMYVIWGLAAPVIWAICKEIDVYDYYYPDKIPGSYGTGPK